MADVAESFGTGSWRFTPEVAGVFDTHVRASVPFYDTIQDLIAEMSDWLVPDGGLIADLGVATGATATRILNRHPERNISLVLYDEQQAMLDQAAKNLDPLAPNKITYRRARIQDPPLQHTDADLTLILFTLQFLSLEDRVAALRLARLSARETGALIVAEKMRPPDPRWTEISNDVSHDWKAAHGITDSAIRAKARALRGVLIPSSQVTLLRMIKAAGWQAPEVLFRWHSWAVVGAFAAPADG
jgi:tRNA (cmo5U34)-methyltransferase